jgi:hypothetical protein
MYMNETQKEVIELNKKLTVNLTQGTLGKLNPPYELLVKNKRNIGHIQTVVDILSRELGVEYKVIPDILDVARSEDTPETRVKALTMALISLATQAAVKNNLHSDISEKELMVKMKVVTKRWAEDVIEKVRTLPELRMKKLLSDRKCRLKNYITKCPVCGAPESSIHKDFKSLTAKCAKCGWSRTFDGSGKRTVPRKKEAKPKAKAKRKT